MLIPLESSEDTDYNRLEIRSIWKIKGCEW